MKMFILCYFLTITLICINCNEVNKYIQYDTEKIVSVSESDKYNNQFEDNKPNRKVNKIKPTDYYTHDTDKTRLSVFKEWENKIIDFSGSGSDSVTGIEDKEVDIPFFDENQLHEISAVRDISGSGSGSGDEYDVTFVDNSIYNNIPKEILSTVESFDTFSGSGSGSGSGSRSIYDYYNVKDRETFADDEDLYNKVICNTGEATSGVQTSDSSATKGSGSGEIEDVVLSYNSEEIYEFEYIID